MIGSDGGSEMWIREGVEEGQVHVHKETFGWGLATLTRKKVHFCDIWGGSRRWSRPHSEKTHFGDVARSKKVHFYEIWGGSRRWSSTCTQRHIWVGLGHVDAKKGAFL